MPTLSSFPCLTGKSNNQRTRRRQKPLTIPQQQTSGPIVWPVELTRHKTERHKIAITSASLSDLPRLFSLPFDIRHHIYSLILQHAGKRQHIFCPAVARRGVPNALQLRYLLSKRYNNTSNTCGHYECEFSSETGAKCGSGSLADFVALMTTCKFVYQEVAHFLYSETTFTFASFRELGTFLDWINPETALSIRSVTFITHMRPEGTEHCKELMEGNYFRGAGRDYVALFRRMPNLRILDINFFPSVMLSFTTKFVEMMEPLRQLSTSVAIKVDLPRIYYRKDKAGEGLPFVRDVVGGTAFYSLTRSVTYTSNVEAACAAYEKFF